MLNNNQGRVVRVAVVPLVLLAPRPGELPLAWLPLQ